MSDSVNGVATLPQINERRTFDRANKPNFNENIGTNDGGSGRRGKAGQNYQNTNKTISLAILQKFDGILKEKISMLKKEVNKDNKEEGIL